MARLRMTGLALAALLCSGMAVAPASAMPANALTTARVATGIENVRWVCGPYRCWWSPGPYWGPGPYWHNGWGWRHYHHW